MKSIYKKIIMKAFTNVILLFSVLTAGAFYYSANAQEVTTMLVAETGNQNVSPQRENRSFSETRKHLDKA